MDTFNRGLDLVASLMITILIVELRRFSHVLEVGLEGAEVRIVGTVTAHLYLLAVCEICGHVLLGVASLDCLTEVCLLDFFQWGLQSGEDLFRVGHLLVGERL